jgi:phosphatidylserine/phosphatidylglycerophosphate/cardiolipin synthase-like enzyme
MTIQDRITKFFVDGSDIVINGEDVPVTSSECRVTHLIDGSNYFGALRQEVDAFKAAGAGNRFFYFTDWLLTLIDYAGTAVAGGVPTAFPEPVRSYAFHLDDKSGGAFPPFIDELAAMAANGVDVRALVWVSPFVLEYKMVAEKEKRYSNYASSVLSVDALRKKPGLEHKTVLNLLAHPVGAMHLKTVVCGDDSNARGYVSGMDFQPGRVDTQEHPNGSTSGDGYGWHDIGAKVEGAAVDTIYRYFQQLWNEQIARPVEQFRVDDTTVASHDAQCEPVADRTFLFVPGATHHVQVLRTAPQFHIASSETPVIPVGCILRVLAGFRRPALSFAPDGIFEFRPALKKAIAAAEQYVYVEDQAFTCREIMDWVHDALIATPTLKAIFVYGLDPTDPPDNVELFHMAVNEHLAPGVPDVADRVAFHFRLDGVVVHTKSWIVDDEFAIIGSANTMRRSLYTDGELSVSVLDENEGSGSFAVDYRCDLWAEHCGVYDAPGRSAFSNLDAALQIWHPSWSIGAAPPGKVDTTKFQRKTVPFVQGTAPDECDPLLLPGLPGAKDRAKIDTVYDEKDGDSRNPF